MQGRSLRWPLAAYALLGVVWLPLLVRHLALDLRFEDAMIVLRYARNLVDGHGFVFNPGERVLGVTTPLHTLLATAWIELGRIDGLPPAAALQNVWGALALLAQGAGLLVLLHRLRYPVLSLPVGVLALGNLGPSYLYLGMETHLFVALGLWILVLAVWERRDQDDDAESPTRRRDLLLGALLGVMFLVRYDAALLALLLGLERWWRARRPPWRLVAGFALPVLPWLVFAQLYFGSIVPQSLGAKESFIGFVFYLERVYHLYVGIFHHALGLFSPVQRINWLFAQAWPGVVAAGALLAVRHDRRWVVPAAWLPLHLLVYAAIGSDPGFTWHVYLLHPLGFAFFAIALFEPAWWLVWRLGLHRRLERVVPLRRSELVLVLSLALAVTPAWRAIDQASHDYEMDPHTRQLFAMGRWLGETYPPETTLLQPSIGILGWTSGLRIVDHAGLVTPGLYFFDDRHATPLDEVVKRHHPDLILQSPWSREAAENINDGEGNDPGRLGYEIVREMEEPHHYVLWERRGRAESTADGEGETPSG